MDMGRATWTQPVDNLPPNVTRSTFSARSFIFGLHIAETV